MIREYGTRQASAIYVAGLMVDSSYKAGYIDGLRSRIPKQFVIIEVTKLEDFHAR